MELSITYVALYVAVSPNVMVPCVELAVALTKLGPPVSVSDDPFPSVSVSAKVTPDTTTLPLFSTVMV